MTKLSIKHIGPIDSVEFEIKKLNVFIGPASSGKSTIAKLISFCSWLEKKCILNIQELNKKTGLLSVLKDFHHFSDEYFNEQSFVKYESDNIILEWYLLKKDGFSIQKKSKVDFRNRKIAYIPAERNFVSAMPNIALGYKDKKDNILNFIETWTEAKSLYNSKDKTYDLNIINSKYFFDDKSKQDSVKLNNGKYIPLETCSSGFQSVIPLILLQDFLFNEVLLKNRIFSTLDKINYTKLLALHLNNSENVNKTSFLLNNLSLNNFINEDDDELLVSVLQKVGIDLNYSFTRMVVEEPEQNIFPDIQKDLIYTLLRNLSSTNYNHELIITTHSPFILYAINNCMLGNLVKDKLSLEEKNKLKSIDSFINPKDVSIYQIEEGCIKSYQNEDGLLGDNFFDNTMKKIMDDFYLFLNHYGDDDDE